MTAAIHNPGMMPSKKGWEGTPLGDLAEQKEKETLRLGYVTRTRKELIPLAESGDEIAQDVLAERYVLTHDVTSADENGPEIQTKVMAITSGTSKEPIRESTRAHAAWLERQFALRNKAEDSNIRSATGYNS